MLSNAARPSASEEAGPVADFGSVGLAPLTGLLGSLKSAPAGTPVSEPQPIAIRKADRTAADNGG